MDMTEHSRLPLEEPVCTTCGHQLVRLVEGSVSSDPSYDKPSFWLSGECSESKVAIFVGTRLKVAVPPFVCLTCQPDWWKCVELAEEQEKYQQMVENKVADSDFEGALDWVDKRKGIEQQREELVNELLSDPYWNGSGWGALLIESTEQSDVTEEDLAARTEEMLQRMARTEEMLQRAAKLEDELRAKGLDL